MPLKLYTSERVSKASSELPFITIVDEPSDADVSVDVGPFRKLMHISVEDSTGILCDEEIREELVRVFACKYPDEYGQYILEKTSVKNIINALKLQNIGEGGKTLYTQFFSEYTNILLSEIRVKYTVKMLEEIKKNMPGDTDDLFKKFLQRYCCAEISTEINVTGFGIWSPELVFAYISEYLLWNLEPVNELYREYVNEKNVTFLGSSLRKYCKALPIGNFSELCTSLSD
jgi:hypothetical protein